MKHGALALAAVLLFSQGAAARAEPVPDGLVCHYVGSSPGRQLVLGFDGSIRFLSPDEEEIQAQDATMKADIFRKTPTSVTYKIVMEGRTDSFYVNRKTRRGTQTLTYPDKPAKTFPLSCDE
jgi:hypothetical protein